MGVITEISLAAARVNAGFTQREVAQMLKVSNKTIVNWETGKADPPFSAVSMMAHIYKVPVDCITLPKKSA